MHTHAPPPLEGNAGRPTARAVVRPCLQAGAALGRILLGQSQPPHVACLLPVEVDVGVAVVLA